MRKTLGLGMVAAAAAWTCIAGESMMASRAWVTNYVASVFEAHDPTVEAEAVEGGMAFTIGGATVTTEDSTVTALVTRAVSPLMEDMGFFDGMTLPLDPEASPADTNLVAAATFRSGDCMIHATPTNYFFVAPFSSGGYEAGTVFLSVTRNGRTVIVEPGAAGTNAPLCRLAWTLVQPTVADEMAEGRWWL